MKFSSKSVAPFVLMLAGAMGFGSLYSALFNTVGREIIPPFFVLILMPVVFMYAGYYCYNFLQYQTGKSGIALGLSVVTALLAAASILGGKSDQQIFFALHEILNLVAAWATAITVGLTFKK